MSAREFKPFIEPRHPKEFEIVKTVVAFANTGGGTLFVGVSDEGIRRGKQRHTSVFAKLKIRQRSVANVKKAHAQNRTPCRVFYTASPR